MSGRAHIQSGRRGFECLAGSVLDEATYNQARQVLDEAQYNQAYEHLYMQSYAGVHTCTSYVAKKVLCYKMIHVSLLPSSSKPLSGIPAPRGVLPWPR